MTTEAIPNVESISITTSSINAPSHVRGEQGTKPPSLLHGRLSTRITTSQQAYPRNTPTHFPKLASLECTGEIVASHVKVKPRQLLATHGARASPHMRWFQQMMPHKQGSTTRSASFVKVALAPTRSRTSSYPARTQEPHNNLTCAQFLNALAPNR